MSNRFYKIGAGIGFALVAFIIMLMVMGKNKDKKIAKAEDTSELIMSSTNVVEDDVLSVDTRKQDFSDIEDKANSNEQKTNKVESNSSKVNTAKSNKTNESNAKSQNTKTEEVEDKDPVFVYPTKGEIITEYAKDKLIYSNTLGEWVTHPGIDIKANKTSIVTASAEGTVKAIKNDPRYGLTVIIEHKKGFSTVYSNLLTAEFVSVGEKVKSGQTIGTVGNTASFEILDEPHLHFEILKNGEQIDPNMYLKS